MLEIMKYLTLNDAVNAFSNNIFPMLRQHLRLTEIYESFDLSTDTIVRKLIPENIVSLRLNTEYQWTESELDTLTIFTNVTSLTLLNFQDMITINIYKTYFPKLIRLALWYDNQIDFNVVKDIFVYLQHSIRQFEIHCPALVCSHNLVDQSGETFTGSFSIQYFVLDMGNFSLPSISDCFYHEQSCLLRTTIPFLANMHNIQHFRLITNSYNAHILLDVDEWIRLIYTIDPLRKVTLQILRSMPSDEDILQKLTQLQSQLFRRVKFQVTFI